MRVNISLPILQRGSAVKELLLHLECNRNSQEKERRLPSAAICAGETPDNRVINHAQAARRGNGAQLIGCMNFSGDLGMSGASRT